MAGEITMLSEMHRLLLLGERSSTVTLAPEALHRLAVFAVMSRWVLLVFAQLAKAFLSGGYIVPSTPLRSQTDRTPTHLSRWPTQWHHREQFASPQWERRTGAKSLGLALS